MLLFTAGAGACIPLGGALANAERILPTWIDNELRHWVIAFGGGVLVAAVALVLVPEGLHAAASPWLGCLLFISGGTVFCGVERWLARSRAEKPMLSAMLLDFLPESMALGGMFATNSPSAVMLAILIGLQNLPEGFNAYREFTPGRSPNRKRALFFMACLVPLGPIMGLAGWLIGPACPELVGGIMLFSAGGILYLIFQDIAPQSRLERHWVPPLGAVLGFCLGMLADLLTRA